MSLFDELTTDGPQARPEVLAFLRHCKDHPEDDTPRLVLADWLEDHGDEHDAARGNLIRLQCELAQLPPADSRRPHLQSCIFQLSDRHTPYWLGPLTRVQHARSYHRGLLHLHLHARALLEKEASSLGRSEAYAWVDQLGFHSFKTRQLPHLGERSLLQGISGLDVSRCRLVEDGVRDLVHCPHLPRLQVLNLASNYLGQVALELLADSKLLTQLTVLDLQSNHLGNEPVIALAGSPNLGRLQRLSLADNRLSDPAAVALAYSQSLTSLTHLDLKTNSLCGPGIEALASCPRMRRLQSLDLRGNPLTDGAVRALTDSPFLTGLKELYLAGHLLSEESQQLLRDRFGAAAQL